MPEVGIIYLVGDKLWIDATSITRAGNFAEVVFHERDHSRYWRLLVEQQVVPSTEHDEFPRGRVSYNRKSGKFILLADVCILCEKGFVASILLRMNLPERGTETGTDSLYRCRRCLGRGR